MIEYTNELDYGENLVTIVYGRSGVGKTKLVATCPKPLLVDFEGKLLSLRESHIPVYKVRSYKEFNAMFKFLHSKEVAEFDTFYFDSLSEVAEQILIAKRESVPNLQKAYGDMAHEVMQFVKVCRALKGNVVFVCKEIEEGVAIPRVMPDLPGKVAKRQMPYHVSLVLRLFVMDDEESEESRRMLQTNPTDTVEAKDLSELLEPLEQPDLTNIFNKISSGVKNGKT